MSAVAIKTEITPEELLRMPDEKDYELVDGELVERKTGSLSSWIGGEVLFLLRQFLQVHPLGWVFGADNGYFCFPRNPNKLRRPDGSFVRHGRLPGDKPPAGYTRIAPDLVVEVVSPNDLAYEIDEKVLDFLGAGVPLVWVVNPDSRVIHIYRVDGSVGLLRETDELSGEDVLPGFHCKVNSIFPPPTADVASTSEDVPTA